jgi:hypothetical protein
MQQVVEEEQSKPLQVNEDFIRRYEDKERKEEARLEAEVERHIFSLKKLKTNLLEKEDKKRRNVEYREKKEELRQRNQAGRIGGGLAGMGERGYSAQSSDYGDERMVTGETKRGGETKFGGASRLPPRGPGGGMGVGGGMGGAGAGANNGTLSKVINSLDRLVDLEKRIARLETDATPGGGGGGGQEQGIHFTSHKTDTTANVPGKKIYSVRLGADKTKGTRSQRGGRGGLGGVGGASGAAANSQDLVAERRGASVAGHGRVRGTHLRPGRARASTSRYVGADVGDRGGRVGDGETVG